MNVTGGEVAAAVQQNKATATIVKVLARSLRPFISLCHCRVDSKRGSTRRMKYWEIIADNLSKAGWSWVVSQRLIRTREQSSLLTRVRGHGQRLVVRPAPHGACISPQHVTPNLLLAHLCVGPLT